MPPVKKFVFQVGAIKIYAIRNIIIKVFIILKIDILI